MKKVLIVFAAFLFSYLAHAFVIMEANPAQWSEPGRFSMVMLGTLAAFLFAAIEFNT